METIIEFLIRVWYRIIVPTCIFAVSYAVAYLIVHLILAIM